MTQERGKADRTARRTVPAEPLPSAGGQQEARPLSWGLISMQSSRKGLGGKTSSRWVPNEPNCQPSLEGDGEQTPAPGVQKRGPSAELCAGVAIVLRHESAGTARERADPQGGAGGSPIRGH